VNIRILATSNRDLEAEVKKGTFREDLYFRLNVISLPLPKLADRVDDIPPLAEYFIEKYSKANGVPKRPLSPAAIAKLKSHGWPGNVRELENIMHRAVLMAQGNVIEDAAILLPASSAASTNAAPAPAAKVEAMTAQSPASSAAKRSDLVGRTLDDVEKELILDTLNHCLGNRTQAANILGISIRTLRNKLNQYAEDTGQRTGSY
jgi:DNA-binding NtrC family response regulator